MTAELVRVPAGDEGLWILRSGSVVIRLTPDGGSIDLPVSKKRALHHVGRDCWVYVYERSRDCLVMTYRGDRAAKLR